MATTTYMLLSLPSPSITAGPAWATQVNAAFSTVDVHDHSANKGIPVPSDGININADLTFSGSGATNVRCVALTLLSAAPADLRSLYSYGGDLYYKNSSGNAVQVTNGSSIAGTTGTISGLTSPASAAYSSVTKTLTFLQDTNKYSILSVGRIVIHDNTTQLANLAGISVLSPLTTSSGAYSITLPTAVPSQAKALVMYTTGALAFEQDAQFSSSTGAIAFSGSATTYTAITNLTMTASFTGRPIMVSCVPDGVNGAAYFAADTPSGAAPRIAVVQIGLYDGASLIYEWTFGGRIGVTTSQINQWLIPPSSISTVITAPSAGTHTYLLKYLITSGSTFEAFATKLVAYEI